MGEITAGARVSHSEFGPGTIVSILGDIAVVNFFGEEIEVKKKELKELKKKTFDVIRKAEKKSYDREKIEFRRAFEAINLGIIPPDPDQLISLTINSDVTKQMIDGWLENAPVDGLCKVVFGYYGSGKSHYLKLAKHIALKAGWVVSFVEFDPKEADPAKPHLVYKSITANLEFPYREDGRRLRGFNEFIKEIREHWYDIKTRRLPHLSKSRWFTSALEIIMACSHNLNNPKYAAACNWLAGHYTALSLLRKLAGSIGYKSLIPRMPAVKESGDIYVFHLVVISELCRAMGYSGLLLILDEAEHVRGYNVRKKERATNFFDILARSAHKPAKLPDPDPNEHEMDVPKYWKSGPHFGLLVGLTEDESFLSPFSSLNELCVFLHDESDRIVLNPPTAEDYESWCTRFLKSFHDFFPDRTALLGDDSVVEEISALLLQFYSRADDDVKVLRNFTKLVSLVPSIILSKRITNKQTLIDMLSETLKSRFQISMPWGE